MGGVPQDLPVAAAYAFLVVVAFCRGGATYVLGRLVRRAGAASRRAELFERPMMLRAERLVRRVGPPVVSLSFLTVGVQSAVNASAGFLRMPLRHYLPALGLGAMVWAGVYVTVGIAVVQAWLGSGSGRWLLAGVTVVGLVAAVSWWVRRRWFPGGGAEAAE
jgi:membrane protein DedA with SNARE-associated domain